MNRLPILHTDDKDMQLMQTGWAAALNPVLANPLVEGTLLRGIQLVPGLNVISHKLGRKLQGFMVTRMRGAASTIYDLNDTNAHPELTLQLNSTATTVVDIFVF